MAERDEPGPPRGGANDALASENARLRARLEEAEETLQALRNGEVDAIVVGDDVYTLESAEAAANRFRSDVLAQMEDAVVALDAQGHVIYLNPAAERLYGVPASRALGLPRDALYRHEWLAPGDEAAVRESLEKSGSWRGLVRHRTRAGEGVLVESMLSRLHGGGAVPGGLLGVVRDVSGRAAAEAAARESQARLQFALEAARIGEWDLDLESGRAQHSLRHDMCFGYTEPPADWSYSVFLRHVHPGDRERVDRSVHEAVAEGGELHFESRVCWSDNSEHWIEVHANVFHEGARPTRMVGIVWDNTARKEAEAVLRRADEQKDEFLATLSHELRNPLAPIRNAMQILRMEPERAVQLRLHEMIERQLGQLVHLVDDLLDVGRISRGKMELRLQHIDMADVLRNAVDSVRPLIERKQHRLDLLLPRKALIVNADMTRLTQVVANVLDNAAKYTPDGGRITLEAEAFDGSVRIVVTDTGIGIPRAMLPRVFDMFTQVDGAQQRPQGGLGIGLGLVKRLVELHGGSVVARSKGEGEGSAVVILLPPAEAEAPAPGPTATAPSPAAGLRVLVVDDNRDGAESLAISLELMGHQIAMAHDGEQALAHAQALEPHLALVDIGLPDISGYEVARRLRAEVWGRSIVLVALTGWGQEDDRRRSREAGFDHHLVKPAEYARLLELLNSVAQARAAGAVAD